MSYLSHINPSGRLLKCRRCFAITAAAGTCSAVQTVDIAAEISPIERPVPLGQHGTTITFSKPNAASTSSGIGIYRSFRFILPVLVRIEAGFKCWVSGELSIFPLLRSIHGMRTLNRLYRGVLENTQTISLIGKCTRFGIVV